jgi:hypothetical protein
MPSRREHMARAGVIRVLAVTGVFLAAAGLGLPSDAPAQTPAERQAVGILFLLGSSRSGTQASAKAPEQKPKPGIAASREAEGRIVAAKQKPVSASRKLDRSVQLTDSSHANHD